MADFFVLSQEDIKVLKGYVERIQKAPQNTRNRPDVEWIDTPTMEVFSALVPDCGLSARVGYNPGGGVECPVFFFTGEGEDGLEYAGFEKVVYNLSDTEIPGGTWILIAKDKGGVWYATSAISYQECEEVTFTETEPYCVGTATEYRSRTVTINIVNGCLEKTVGEWDDPLDCEPGTATATSTSTGTGTELGTGTSTAGNISSACCPTTGIPSTLTATISATGACSGISGSYSPMVYDSGTSKWSYSGASFTVTLECVAGVFLLSMSISGQGSGSNGPLVVSCSPFSVTFALTVGGCSPVNVTITV